MSAQLLWISILFCMQLCFFLTLLANIFLENVEKDEAKLLEPIKMHA